MTTGIGDTLRAAREEQGRTLEEIAQTLRVRAERLRAIEDERFGVFSGDVYAKGFIRNYARELGVDPQPLLDIYRREIGHDDGLATDRVTEVAGRSSANRRPMPAWVAWAAIIGLVVLGLAALNALDLGTRTPEIASPGDRPPASAPQDESETAAPEPDPEPDPDPEPAPEGVELLLALEERSWMRVVVDGQLVDERTAQPGETLQYRGEQEIVVRFGNAGGVRAQLNGQDLGPQGGHGEVVDVIFTSEGVDEA